MTSTIACPATSQLSEDDLITMSLVFPRHIQLQLIEHRRALNKRNASFRTYGSGVVDTDAMLKEVALKLSAKTAEPVSSLVAQGICLQAIASVPLTIPIAGTERL